MLGVHITVIKGGTKGRSIEGGSREAQEIPMADPQP